MLDKTHCDARVGARVVGPVAAAAMVLAIWSAAALVASASATAKTPGARYCFARACHRVMTLAETRAAVGKPTSAVTSFYDDCRRDPYNPCGLTSSGEAFRPGETNSAASPIYPDGTVVLVRNPRNGETAIVRINNAGPYWGNRTLDLSRAAGNKLGLGRVGVAKVEVTVLRAPTRSEATYRRNRVYPRLPGHVGQFASLGEAQVFAALKLDLPDAIGSGLIAVAQAHPQVALVAPASFEPLAGDAPGRRLPADVIRVSNVQTAAARPGEPLRKAGVAAISDPEAPSLVVRAVEIRGASLLVPPAGETTRVVSERATIVGALRAGDFDRRGRSLLKAVATRTGGDDPAVPGEPASLAAVSAEDAALGGVEPLTLERMPPLATRGERGWYRRATAPVTHVVAFGSNNLTTPPTRIAHWAALRLASFSPARNGPDGMDEVDAALRSVAKRPIARSAPDDDRLRRVTLSPARARTEEFYAFVA